MFIDASAIVAVINQEPGWQELAKRLDEVQDTCSISPFVRFEASLGIARAAARAGGAETSSSPELLASARALVDDLVREIGATEIAISGAIGEAAMDAAATYGRAVGHPADLNFGDCFAYACAKANRLRLLCKGDDFARTDLA